MRDAAGGSLGSPEREGVRRRQLCLLGRELSCLRDRQVILSRRIFQTSECVPSKSEGGFVGQTIKRVSCTAIYNENTTQRTLLSSKCLPLPLLPPREEPPPH